jgi:uncharacterized protein with FMN-binding domain
MTADALHETQAKIDREISLMSQTRNNIKLNNNNKMVRDALPPTDWPLTARKVGLSLLVVLGFAGYAYRDHFGITADGAALPPAAAASTNSSAASASAAQPAVNNNSGQAGNVQAAPVAAAGTNGYKDGTFTGPVVDAYYGNVQVQAIIQGGKISQVKFLDYPHDRRTSQMINNQAMPWLNNEAITAQTAQVNIISGATFTSEGFQQSLQAALAQAKA